MSDTRSDDRVLVGIAALSAFAAGLFAVAQHASCTSAGYRLAVVQRENLELRRAAEQAERHVSALSTAQAAMSRVTASMLASKPTALQGTRLEYPKTWNVAAAATIRSCALAAPAPVNVAPDATKGASR